MGSSQDRRGSKAKPVHRAGADRNGPLEAKRTPARGAARQSGLERGSAATRSRVSGSAATRSRVPKTLIFGLLVVVTLVVFHEVFRHEFVDFDDFPYVVENPHIARGLDLEGLTWAFTSAYEGYWAPLTWLSYMADVELFGISSAAAHGTNLLLHVLSACLLFAFLDRATGARLPSAGVAALFAIHPLHVESVAWVAERKDVLSTFWFFLAAWAYVGYVEERTPARYALVAAALGFGLMSKPMLVTLPVILLLLDIWPLGRLEGAGTGARARKSQPASGAVPAAPGAPETPTGLVIEKLPLFALSAIFAVITVVVQARAGAVATLEETPVSMRAANALVSTVVYLGQMLWPAGLAAIYPYPRTPPIVAATAAALLVAAISFAVFRTWRRAPYLLTGWLWYLVILAPVLGFVQAGPQARADRYTYVSMTGIAIIAAWGLKDLLGRFPRTRTAVAAATCVALAAFGAASFQQVRHWRTTQTVFRRALDVTTGNYVAHKGLGTELLRAGRADEALVHLRTAVSLAPGFPEAHLDLGRALVAANQPETALVNLRRAVELRPDEENFRLNLGSALHSLERSREAEAEYREALRISPSSPAAHSGLGLALAQQGDTEGARAEFETAIRLDPLYADAYLNLATMEARAGRVAEAERAFREHLRLTPDSAGGYIGLGTLLAREGRTTDAAAALSTAVRLRPDDAILRSNLGITLIQGGRIEEGIQQLSEAVRLRPDLPEPRHNLDLALGMRGSAGPEMPATSTLPVPKK